MRECPIATSTGRDKQELRVQLDEHLAAIRLALTSLDGHLGSAAALAELRQIIAEIEGSLTALDHDR